MKQPLSAQVKRGLATAFTKFSEYALAKYNRDGAVKLKDVLFLCHAKPKDKEQAAAWKRLINDELVVPDTWEVALSTGKNKKDTWTRLLTEKKLGGLALLRNLRNMREARVDRDVIQVSLAEMNVDRVLPFRFISAAKHNPDIEDMIEVPFLAACRERRKLPGHTIFVVDVSGSMYGVPLSGKSELTRIDVACALAAMVRETCEFSTIYATSGSDRTRIHKTVVVPARHGFALADAIKGLSNNYDGGMLGGGGIFLTAATKWIHERTDSPVARIIVITDEQDCAGASDPPSKAQPFGDHNYIVNVASAKNGIAYDKWTHINGWSDAILDYIAAAEQGRESQISRN